MGPFDWGSPRLHAEFSFLERLVEWSSHSSDSEEEELVTRGSQALETQSEGGDVPESVLGTEEAAGTSIHHKQLFLNRPSTTQTRAPAYRQGVLRIPSFRSGVATIHPGLGLYLKASLSN